MSKNNTVTGLRFPEIVLNKLRYISWYERKTFTEIIISLSEKCISDFEQENGLITEEQISKIQKKG
jgi:hypothetical protein